MSKPVLCPECGALLPSGQPKALCPRCALSSLIASDNTSASSALPASEPGDILGRYKLLQKIGEGGMGEVWMAEQSEPIRRQVALKIIKLGMDTKSVIARFEAERQALALMDHPNIAKVFDAGATDSGRPYFVMELVRGVRITEYCDEHKLTPRARLDLFVQVCHATQHAHQKGIIHRDIKPSNILVTLHDGEPVPQVIDFGIAKATSDQRLTDKTLFTAFEQFMGTPAYMSPEQAEMGGLDIDTRSDIYSLGVLLYEMLTGKTPFDAKELLAVGFEEMRRTIREKEPAKPSTRLSTMLDAEQTTLAIHHQTEPGKLATLLRGDLDWIVMKALEKDRARRYDTANSLALDIQRFLKSEPVLARPPSALYRLKKFARRNKALVGASVLTFGALSAGVTLATTMWVRERAARQSAVEAGKLQQLALRESITARNAAIAANRNEAAERERAEGVLRRLELQKAAELLGAGDTPTGLAFLARVLREDPSQAVAAERTLATLTQSGFALPDLDPLVHDDAPTAARFSVDGQRVVTAAGRVVRFWDSTTGAQSGSPWRVAGVIQDLQVSADGKQVVVATDANQAMVFDLGATQMLAAPLLHKGKVHAASFSPGSEFVLTASHDGTACVWDARTGTLVSTVRHGGCVVHACFSPDGRHFATASLDNTARLWLTRTGQPASAPLAHDGIVFQVAFSPDGRLLVSASEDKTAKVWDTTTGSPAYSPLKHVASVFHAEFSPDGQHLVTASADTRARIWSARDGQLITESLKHSATVSIARFSRDGRRLVTTSSDMTARIWDVRSGQPLSEPLQHEGHLLAAEFSPDDSRVATASADGTVRLWRLPNAAVPAPSWLPELAEAVAGRRLNAQRLLEPVPGDALESVRQKLLNLPLTNAYLVWASWFFSDPEARPFSPFNTVSRNEYVRRRLDGNTLSGFKEAARLAPSNALTLVRAAAGVLAWSSNRAHVVEAESWLRRAGELTPDEPTMWRARVQIWERTGNFEGSLSDLSRALAQAAADPWLHYGHAMLLEKNGSFEAAVDAATLGLDALKAAGEPVGDLLVNTLLLRSRVLAQIGRLPQARDDYLRARNLPARPPTAADQLVDLSMFYNARLDDRRHQAESGNHLGNLPAGVTRLAGVDFDVRGVVQLSSKNLQPFYPNQVTNIYLGRAVHQLHFLHGTSWSDAPDTPVATFILHYADGHTRRVPVIFGRDVLGWWYEPTRNEKPILAPVAWTGINPAVEKAGKRIRLYKMTWENPEPNLEISSIDYVSAMKSSAPFLIAITAED